MNLAVRGVMVAKDLTPVSVAVIRRGERLAIEIIPIEKKTAEGKAILVSRGRFVRWLRQRSSGPG